MKEIFKEKRKLPLLFLASLSVFTSSSNRLKCVSKYFIK